MSTADARHNLPPEIEQALLARLSAPAPLERPRRDPTGPRRLPAVQHRIWVTDRLDEGEPINTVGLAVRLRGRLDRRALTRAVDAVVAAHEELRTVVTERDGVPSARTLASVVVPVEEAGLGTSLESLADLAGRRLDPGSGSNVRCLLIPVGPDEHVVLLLVHHLVCDAASLGILLRDLGRAYSGRPPAPPASPYAELAELSERRAARTREHDLAYWRETLTGAPATLDLDCARTPLSRTGRGAVDVLPLAEGLIDAAAGLGLARGAPLSSVLLAAWVSVLRRHSAQDDLVVGTAVDERNIPGAEHVVGPFVNLVPLRVRLSPAASRDELLTASRDALLGALDHAALPFERLVAAVRPPRRPGRHPIFQTTFDLRRELPRPCRFGDLHAEPIPLGIAPARVDLGLSIDRTADGWQARLVSSTGLFAPGTGRRLLDDLAEALHSLIEPPPGPVFVEAPARPVVRVTSPLSGSVLEAVDRWAARLPYAVAVEDGRRALTYRELTGRSRSLAGRLAALGAGPGVPVGVLLNRDCELVTGLLGVLRSGSPYVPLDPDHPRARIRALLADAGAEILLTTPEFAEYAPAGVRAVTPGDAATPAVARLDDLAYVIYTSGSTGPPKGVEITHRALAAVLAAMGELIEAGPGDALLAITTVAFDIAALELFLPLTRGARVVVAPSGTAADPGLIRALVAAHGVTVLQATPVTWRLLGPGTLPGLRAALCGGEWLPADLAPWIAGTAERAWNVYGPTEATIWATTHRLDHSGRPVPIGRPLPGTRAYVLDHELLPVLPGNPGELCLAGAGVARGYRGRPGLTADRFPPDPYADGARLYRTGDRVRLRDDGTLDYLGRLDDQLKVRGLRVEPGEIEGAVRALPGIRDAAVTAVPGPSGEPVLTCYVVGESVPAQLRSALRERLPGHLVPDAFVTLDALPLTPNGKLDRRALPAPAPPPQGIVATGPRGEVEHVIREVWQDVLGRSPVHAHEDFFDLGGHSLLAARVAARLRTRLDLDVPLRLLLDHPTVAATARALHGLGPAGLPPVGPAPHDHDEAAPLTVAQYQVWLLCQDPRAGLAYHVHTVLPVPEHVTVDRLRAALDELTRRHCVLRTRYPVVDGEPRQVADGPPVADLVTSSPSQAFLAAAVREPFVPAEVPPVRWRLVRDGNGPARLALVAHHIALDGWSLALLERELAALLDGADLPPAPCFGAIARWQRDCLTSAELDRQRGYWRTRLAAPRPVTAPPYDRVPPPRPDFRGDVVRA
ncbi:amino acid adenylation domain-containing protein, partial [Nonomuraea sp. NPDC059023]